MRVIYTDFNGFLTIVLTLLFITILSSCETTTFPEFSRQANVDITNFAVDSSDTNNVSYTVDFKYQLEISNTEAALDPVVLYTSLRCDCDPSTRNVTDVYMDKIEDETSHGWVGFIPSEATEVWVNFRWVDDSGENQIESEHISIQ